MGVRVDKYIDLEKNIAIYGKKGMFVEPFLLTTIIVEELNLPMSYSEIKEFVNTCEIMITEEEIKVFLEQKRNEEYPNLKQELENYTPISKNLSEVTQEDIEADAQNFGNELLNGRYEFYPYTLKYYKNYVSILKGKCADFFLLIEYLKKGKKNEISKEEQDTLLKYDFHINELGNIYYEDAERFLNPFLYNLKNLYTKVQEGNNPKTYLKVKKSLHSLGRDGILESELYPSQELQLQNLAYIGTPGYIALSKDQEEKLKQNHFDFISKMIEEDFWEDDFPTRKIEKK